MPRPTVYTNEQIIKALRKTKGMVYLAAREIGCEADTIYYRAKKSKAIQACLKSERGRIVDTAELKLYEAMMKGEPWAVTMMLKMLGKERGYIERQEISGPNGGAIPHVTEVRIIMPADDYSTPAPTLGPVTIERQASNGHVNGDG